MKPAKPKPGSVFPATMGDGETRPQTEQGLFMKYRSNLFCLVLLVVGIVVATAVSGGSEKGPDTTGDNNNDGDDGDGGDVVVVVECPTGFQPDSMTDFLSPSPCTDVDECTLNTDNCHDDNERCRNTRGSFQCEPCKSDKEVASKDGKGCIIVANDDGWEIDVYNECPADKYPGVLIDNNHRMVGVDEDELSGLLGDYAEFGTSLTFLGDLNADGVNDLAVSAWTDGGGGTERGAVFVILMQANGAIKSVEKISSIRGGIESHILNYERFGKSIVGVGDLDGDGVRDMLVAAHAPEAIYVLYLEPTGFVKSERKITTLEYGLNQGEDFGRCMAAMGDMNGDGNPDVAVGMPLADERRGAVILLFLNGDGTVQSEYVIGYSSSHLSGELDPGDEFATSMAAIGDFDGNGTPDLAVGAVQDDDGGNNRGALYILTLNPDWTVKSSKKISSARGGLTGPLSDGDSFGYVGAAGDLDGDGVMDLLVGAIHDWDDSVKSTGALYVLLLDAEGNVRKEQKISRRKTGLTELEEDNRFGMSPTVIGYVGDGVVRIATGVPGVGMEKELEEASFKLGVRNEPEEIEQVESLVPVGALYMLDVHACTPVDVDECVLGRDNCPQLSHMCRNTPGSFECIECETGHIEAEDGLSCIPNDGDINECTRGLDNCPPSSMCVNTEGSYECRECPSGQMVAEDGLRCITDVCFGEVCEEVEETCVRFGDGRFVCQDFCTVAAEPKTLQFVDSTSGGHAEIQPHAHFGTAMDAIGDIDGDGIPELAVGIPGSDERGVNAGAVYIMFYDSEFHVKAQTRIIGIQGASYKFGEALASLGDVDGDGVGDLVVGAPMDNDGGIERGAVFVVFLTKRGGRKREVKISSTRAGLKPVASRARFGGGVTGLGDLDEDGVVDFAVGAKLGKDGGGDVTIVFLNNDGTVKGEQRIGLNEGGFTGTISAGDLFYKVAKVGDLNGDGIVDLGVGATGDAGGAAYLLLLNRDGTVQEHHKLGATDGGVKGPIKSGDDFGAAIASLGDVNQDGVTDLAVTTPTDGIGGFYVFYMNPDFTVKSERYINARQISLSIYPQKLLGAQLVNLGDTNGNGAVDLAISVPHGPDESFFLGGVFLFEVPRGIIRECPF